MGLLLCILSLTSCRVRLPTQPHLSLAYRHRIWTCLGRLIVRPALLGDMASLKTLRQAYRTFPVLMIYILLVKAKQSISGFLGA
jgi:hypothetical protein